MSEILAYIATNWVKWLFAACLAGLTLAWRTVVARLKEEQKKNEAIAEGVQSLLRESIVNNYNRYSDKGYCPIYAKESLKRAYHAYHDGLGGNDVVTELYNKILKMPTEPGKEGGEGETER